MGVDGMSETLTLTDFLLARIAEDEAAARYATTRDSVGQADWGGWWFGHQQHYSRHDPARVLAECEARRRIVERCSAVDYAMPSTHLAHGVLAELATPYSDHPDFREEWKP